MLLQEDRGLSVVLPKKCFGVTRGCRSCGRDSSFVKGNQWKMNLYKESRNRVKNPERKDKEGQNCCFGWLLGFFV